MPGLAVSLVLVSVAVAVSLSVTHAALVEVRPVNVFDGERGAVPVNALCARVWVVSVERDVAELGARGPDTAEPVLLFVGEDGRELGPYPTELP